MQKTGAASPKRIKEPTEFAVNRGEGGALSRRAITRGIIGEYAVGLVHRRDVDEQKQGRAQRVATLVSTSTDHRAALFNDRKATVDLVCRRVGIGHPEGSRPVAFAEHLGQDSAERISLVEKAGATDTRGVIASVSEPGDDIGGVENRGFVGGCF